MLERQCLSRRRATTLHRGHKAAASRKAKWGSEVQIGLCEKQTAGGSTGALALLITGPRSYSGRSSQGCDWCCQHRGQRGHGLRSDNMQTHLEFIALDQRSQFSISSRNKAAASQHANQCIYNSDSPFFHLCPSRLISSLLQSHN